MNTMLWLGKTARICRDRSVESEKVDRARIMILRANLGRKIVETRGYPGINLRRVVISISSRNLLSDL